MVKGISRQVIVVRSPDPKMFEQAIFILRDGQKVITDEVLLKEANRLIESTRGRNNRRFFISCALWAIVGAAITGLAWLLSALI